jgi:hypothetical protein
MAEEIQMIEATREVMTVYFQNPRAEDFVLLDNELMEWDCSEQARCSLVLERLDVNMAFLLRNIFLGPSMDYLINRSMTFSVQFNQLMPDALNAFFQENSSDLDLDLDLAFVEVKNKKFPENIQFICPSKVLLASWIRGIAYAVTYNRFEKNTRVDFMVVLSSEQRVQLERLLPMGQHELNIYHLEDGHLVPLQCSQSGEDAHLSDFMTMIHKPLTLQLAAAEEQAETTGSASSVRPVSFLKPMQSQQLLRYSQATHRKPLQHIIETAEEHSDDEEERHACGND